MSTFGDKDEIEPKPKPPARRRDRRQNSGADVLETYVAMAAGFAGAVRGFIDGIHMAQLSGTPHSLGSCISGFSCPIHGEHNRRKAEEARKALEEGNKPE